MSHGNKALPRVTEMTWPPKNGEVSKPYHSRARPQPSHSQQTDDREDPLSW